VIAQLNDAPARAGGRVVYRLEQLDAVEGGDIADRRDPWC